MARAAATAGTFSFVAVGLALAATPSCSTDPPAAAKDDSVARGEALYKEMCVRCHGTRGEGVGGPSLRDWSRGEPELARIIDARMPLGEPDRCDAACARAIARYVVEAFKGPLVCEAPPPGPRLLRLLTRREYVRSVSDLLGGGSTGAPCDVATFSFDAKGRALATVHVAGTFNGWAGKIAQGGWPLVSTNGVWTLTRKVPTGTHEYKLVLNESEWIADPTNTRTAPDGFGGQNSVLETKCAGGGAADLDALTAGFPPETRPEGFLFDDHGPARVATGVLVEEHLRVAAQIARAVDVAPLAKCDPQATREACAESFATRFGRRVFRRPLGKDEVDRLRGVALAAPTADAGLRAALRVMLASPSFLYRSELGERQPDGTFRLTPHEAAAALSYTLWGTTPDDALLDAADKGELASARGIEAQARRLLASPRAREQIGTFADQWLGAEQIATVDKHQGMFPDMTPDLRASMREETRRLVTHVVFDGSHGYGELVTADYTFVDERLARHYGLAGVSGGDFRKVSYPDGLRAGVLGHASLLGATAHSDQTSPIRRGLMVRRRLLCQDLPPPPPNAGGLPKVDPNATTRERFAQHTSNPFCKSCHQYIDGVGFGFERFDPVGRVRDAENGRPIELLGDMNDVERLGAGTSAPFSTLAELGKTVASSDSGKACVTKQYWRFAHGHAEADACSVLPVHARFRDKAFDLRELVIATVTSPDFVVRK
jgi:hypothetical protein